jgi:hypothetical protein
VLLETRLSRAQIYSRILIITKKSGRAVKFVRVSLSLPGKRPSRLLYQQGDTAMKKLPAIFAVLRIALGFALSAGPASAQSFCACDGTGNVLVISNKAFVPKSDKAVLNDHALRAYAAVPALGLGGDSNAPAVTGGGSVGYNEMLRNF